MWIVRSVVVIICNQREDQEISFRSVLFKWLLKFWILLNLNVFSGLHSCCSVVLLKFLTCCTETALVVVLCWQKKGNACSVPRWSLFICSVIVHCTVSSTMNLITWLVLILVCCTWAAVAACWWSTWTTIMQKKKGECVRRFDEDDHSPRILRWMECSNDTL